MSMLSSQIDGLRTAAQTERAFGHYELEQMLLDAADTIWQLRDDLQRANAAVQDAEHDESMAWDRVRKAEAESASLRGAAQGLGELCDKYKAENAKLRDELADAPKCDACEAMLDCDECLRADGSHKEHRRLSAENAKLREERDMYRDLVDCMVHPDIPDQLAAENAELRELVQNLRRVTPADVVGVVIGANTDHPSYYKFDKAFRELGIEVN